MVIHVVIHGYRHCYGWLYMVIGGYIGVIHGYRWLYMVIGGYSWL